MSWHNKKFIDFILLQRGYDLTKEQIIPGIYPVVTSTSIMGYHNTYKVNGPGVVTGRSGTIGEVQYITKNYWPHNTTLYVKDFKGNHPKFVYYFMKNFGTIRAKSGSAVPTLNRNNLSDMNVKVPDYEIQVCITDILSSYDSLIENNQKQIKLLEEAAQRLYKEWFVDLHFPGYEDVKIVDGVPEGWKIAPINMVAKLKAGGDKPKTFSEKMTNENKIPVFANGITEKGLMGFTDKAVISDSSVTISARGTVGVVFLRTAPYVPIVRLISVTPIDDKIDILYLYLYLVNQNFRSTGAAQQQITVPLLKSKNIVCPSDDIRKSFNGVITPIFNKIEILENYVNKLIEARDRLLPKLMSGEIEV